MGHNGLFKASLAGGALRSPIKEGRKIEIAESEEINVIEGGDKPSSQQRTSHISSRVLT
jgi:hypothetical protein